MTKSREKSEQGGSCGGRETQGLHSSGKGFGGKHVTASRTKVLTDERQVRVEIDKYCLLFPVGEEIRPGCSARHRKETEPKWGGEPRPELSAFCNWGSCEKDIKDLQELNSCRTVETQKRREPCAQLS